MADNNHTDQVLSCLTEAGQALTIRNITATTGLKSDEAKQALDELRSAGKVESAKVGRSERWSLTTPEDTTAETADEDTGTDSGAKSEEAAESGADASDTAENSSSEIEDRAEDSTEVDSEAEGAEVVPLPAPKQVDPEVVFAATMLDQVGTDTAFTIGSFAERCGKTTTAERNRLLRSLWALAEHGLVRMTNPSEIDGTGWAINETGLAATVIERRIQSTDAPDEIEVMAVKRMPWANGGPKATGGRAGRPSNARRRGELREQIGKA
jgi:hypothetical protein